jgi:hypothetical protein
MGKLSRNTGFEWRSAGDRQSQYGFTLSANGPAQQFLTVPG